VLWQTGRADEALALFDAALGRRKEYADAHYMRGTIFRQRGDLDVALASFRETIRINPASAEAQTSLGQVLQLRHDAAGAAAAFALGLAPLGGALAAVLVWRERHGRIAPLARAIVFIGLVAAADVLWVSLLVAGTLLADDGDGLAAVVVAIAGLLTIAVRVDWTILVGMLAIVTVFRVVRRAFPSVARLRLSAHQR
jgi:tetratricopeptide (TPR) repeat protein